MGTTIALIVYGAACATIPVMWRRSRDRASFRRQMDKLARIHREPNWGSNLEDGAR
jgi:hypothetical protein